VAKERGEERLTLPKEGNKDYFSLPDPTSRFKFILREGKGKYRYLPNGNKNFRV